MCDAGTAVLVQGGGGTVCRVKCRMKEISLILLTIVATIQQHWLPIQPTILFKVACIIYKVVTTHQPSYLRTLLQYYTPNCALHTANSHGVCPGIPACFSATPH